MKLQWEKKCGDWQSVSYSDFLSCSRILHKICNTIFQWQKVNYYYFKLILASAETTSIRKSIRSLEQSTCIRFWEVTSTFRSRRIDVYGRNDGWVKRDWLLIHWNEVFLFHIFWMIRNHIFWMIRKGGKSLPHYPEERLTITHN